MYESSARLARPSACLTGGQSAASEEQPHNYFSHVHFEYMLYVVLLGVRSTYDLTPILQKSALLTVSDLFLVFLMILIFLLFLMFFMFLNPDLAKVCSEKFSLIELHCCKG